jgi:hypothetical protein
MLRSCRGSSISPLARYLRYLRGSRLNKSSSASGLSRGIIKRQLVLASQVRVPCALLDVQSWLDSSSMCRLDGAGIPLDVATECMSTHSLLSNIFGITRVR